MISRSLYKTSHIAILLGLAMFVSCKPDLDKIENITRNNNLPIETADELRIVYSSNAQVQMIMEAPLMERYAGEKPYMELPLGFLMIFYDSLMNETSRISANYAIQYADDELIDARNDVVVENIENRERLNTEQLLWDQRKGIIYTESFVKITTNEEVLYGDGFESDERFTSWIIKKPRGTFSVDMGDDEQSREIDDSENNEGTID
jgi:LPS export ABC transporter protein LptC